MVRWTSRMVLLAPLLAACSSKWSFVDQDGDGLSAAEGDCWDAVEGPAGSGLTGDQIHPGADERWYDGFDQDCGGDNDFDQDGDGFVPDEYQAQAGELVAGDCDDTVAQVNPAAIDEYYDGVDTDCSGNDDFDQDGDGYVPDEYAGRTTEYVEGSGALDSGDCDDLEATVNPAAADEWYDGVDTDCAGNDDFDQDGDGYVPLEYDGEVTVYVDGSGNLPAGDCDDTDAGRVPDDTKTVVWYNGYDERCNENDGDQDGDGFWDERYAEKVAASGSGFDPLPIPTGMEGDCFDDPDDRPSLGDTSNELVPINGGAVLDPDQIYPGADDDAYDGVDADCADDSDFDKDGDLYDSECVPQRDGSYGDDCLDSDDPVDCGDDDPASLGALGIYPGAYETWYDGTDADCNDRDDFDYDNDGYIPDGYGSIYTGSLPDGDCDDLEGAINPSVADTWYDGVDTDCSGNDDYDQDADGYVKDIHAGRTTEYVAGSGALPDGDCDDLDDDVNPGESDSWYDGEDTNCSGNDDYDRDGDGYVPDEYVGRATEYVSGSGSLPGNDCDDTDGGVNPGESDTWYDGEDTNCSGNDDYDQDADGYVPDSYAGRTTEYVSGSGSLPDGDCDDTDDGVNPGESDTWYDGEDTNCSGNDDYDRDSDGYVRDVDAGKTTTYVSGSGSLPDGDCDDNASDVNPGESDTWYDGEDTNCSGNDDYDRDGDEFVRDADVGKATTYVSGSGGLPGNDCNDTDATINPDATEVWYDGTDQDCDEWSDYDADLDGQDSDDYAGTDCDDTDDAVYYGATETCATDYDDDCDGDDNDRNAVDCSTFNYDGDGDDYGTTSTRCYCEENGAWSATNDDDCDDAEATTYPGAPDTWYDGVDSDCAEDSDYDRDVDGYDSDAHGGDDCDDGVATTYPGAPDTWYDGVDSNCDGESDYDRDGDGEDSDAYGGDDCDDNNSAVNTGATETCATDYDDDCDGNDNDRDATGCDDFNYDGDDDGYGIDSTRCYCEESGFWSATNDDDCDDLVATTYPGAPDTWYDGVDSDCAENDDFDRDADGYQSDSYGGDDCNDAVASINPGATEVWYDGTDKDCSGGSDYDADGDGDDHDGYGGTDCDDGDINIYGGAPDTWYDGVDSDCDGESDYDKDGDGDDIDTHAGGTDCDDDDATRSGLLTETAGSTGKDDDCDEYIDEDFVNVGDLILSEAMVDTIESAGTESTEWFEIYNTSGSTIYLDGWGFEEFMGGSSANGFVVSPDAGLTIDSDSYLVFCLSSGIAGVTCDYVYGTNAYGPSIHGDVDNGSWLMNNSGGPLTIALDSTTIDEVDISASFGYGNGISAELGFDVMDDSSNDVDTNWCAATNLYTSTGGDQYGTPNGVNDCEIGGGDSGG